MPKIAIIEDDKNLNNYYKQLLDSLPDVIIAQYFDRVSAEEAIVKDHFDLVVLDIELGQAPKDKFGGLSILSKLRGKKTVTLVVSGISEESLPNIVITLQAYDFIGKPINELDFINKAEHGLASQLPENAENLAENVGKIWPKNLTPDPDQYPGFHWKGKRVRLTITHARIINCLIKMPGKAVDKITLAKQLGTSNASGAIATHITDIRNRFLEIDPEFSAIQMNPGKGYVWIS